MKWASKNISYLAKLNIKNIQETYAIYCTTREAGTAEALYEVRREDCVINQNLLVSKVPCDLYAP